jgi:nucleotide-binding universal stress UspA family protein
VSYKTILVHLNNEARVRDILGPALDLARTFDARLIGLHAFPAYRLTPPVPMPLAKDLAGQIRGAITKEAQAIKSLFDEITVIEAIPTEWRSITTEGRDPALIVLDHSRAADLVIASQADPDWQFSDILDFPDRLAIESGRPVLAIPNVGRFKGVPRIITVAWSGRRESARAVFDALPLLKRAQLVHVTTVDEGSEPLEGGLAGTAIADTLARHGVEVQVSSGEANEATVGEELRSRAAQHGSDLLVMGCYGRSRFREFALGGATRHILRDMTIPTLLSH